MCDMRTLYVCKLFWLHCLYVDAAISAPFGDQPGTVYIYAGAGSDIINENPIQVIHMTMCMCKSLTLFLYLEF